MTELNKYDIMLDLETLGVSAGCAILSIGAVSLNLEYQFYERIKPSSNFLYHLKTDAATRAWWDRQSSASRDESFSGTMDLKDVLLKFNAFLITLPLNGKELNIWGNGADFDIPILRAAYAATNTATYIPPLGARCFRTVKNLFPEIEKPPAVGEAHTALADAINQANHLNLILASLKK